MVTFTDEEVKELLDVMESSMDRCDFDKEELSGLQRVIYLKLGGELESITGEEN